MMAVASYREARSVVAVSKSPVFHHQYSSITKAISNLAKDERELGRVQKLFKGQWLEYFPLSSVNYFQGCGQYISRACAVFERSPISAQSEQRD